MTPIAMKQGDVFTGIQSGYKIYEGKYDTEPIYASDGDTFSMLVGEAGAMHLTSLAAFAISALLTIF